MSGKLYRSRVEKMVGGVCGGIAEYLDIDVTLVRIICLLAIFSGIGLIPYIIAWILIPENPYQLKGKIVEEEPKAEEHQQDSTVEAEDKSNKVNEVLGWALVIFGALLLLDRLLPWLSFKIIWPVLLIIIGLGILLKKT
ncbi:MAG: Phage shock protein C, PspC [Caldanaerobacter subterraneus]|uniref:Phage shock protein C, PspC n=2 Tax=Thermoanaerobacter TaxID=1754 RepID=B0KAJ1_THEP3|nr:MULTISPECIES: PspC domain-containing protein [Thermoanaerobacter]KUJ91103.1 MAG: phage shock protein PspC [Thermoanaerobacter thermocopriae]KUK35608.1 MAG: Phage shock protein C, PspC [Caldanaerobacter subterraneus]ABY93429.1 phage shock protein C, PspC [Thermoanaerobacter sp. X514]ABY95125.1 phage shock protein C, PspC [Thermoanaerobacter pseudethanolicus ATCC 33223]ADV80076.1 PspC domain protein [Thermoanaerobacter brockii subsp. finnii Ako-1]